MAKNSQQILEMRCSNWVGAKTRVPRVGRIIMREGKLFSIRPRLIGALPSAARVWWDSHNRHGSQDRCILDYWCTRKHPGYLTVQYVRSMPGTTLASMRGAMKCLEAIAEHRGAQAMLAHVCTTAISDRLLVRWGWEQHANRLEGRHWIKRFYGQYPPHQLDRYC